MRRSSSSGNAAGQPPTASDALAAVETALSARARPVAIEPTLNRIDAALQLLGNPQDRLRGIHLTGTNGKTSTSRLVDALLRAHGQFTGRFTSPHLSSVTERIVLDGSPLPAGSFVDRYQKNCATIRRFAPELASSLSFFEELVALGYTVFGTEGVDAAVIEVGLGGRWDATNVFDAEVAVLMPIDLDHREFLGDTITEIAREKAGIIKPASTVVVAAQPPDADREIDRRAADVRAHVLREGRDFGCRERHLLGGGQIVTLQGPYGRHRDLWLPLLGAHQAQNASCAVAAAEALLGSPLDTGKAADALAHVRSPGRLEVLQADPPIIVDAAHNPHGLAATLKAVHESFPGRRLVVVLAVLSDKDARRMSELLADAADHLVVTQNTSPRCLTADRLAAFARTALGHRRVRVEESLPDAIGVATDLLDRDTVVLITGSVATAGEARAAWTGERWAF